MTSQADTAWQNEMGIGMQSSPVSFVGRGDLDVVSASYAHGLRRAFDLLDLDGAVCDQNSVLVYLKTVAQVTPDNVSALHRQFWNLGGAPILVLVSSTDVHVFSALAKPDYSGMDPSRRLSGLVVTLKRASSALREFLPSVESGEFFRRHSRSFDPTKRVDRALLDNLQAAREKLAAVSVTDTSAEVLDAFLCRLVFTCYLFDRECIGGSYLASIGVPDRSHLRDVLSIQPPSEARAALSQLFTQLALDFNGDLFGDVLDAETALLTDSHIEIANQFFQGTDVMTGQEAFWPYDFSLIPIETISAIYERFLKQADKWSGAFYTPRYLAEVVLDLTVGDRPSLLGLRVLDPACGSGIFLVGMFNRIVEEWRRTNPQAPNDVRASELMRILQSQIFGVDVNRTACRITAFSLYLAYLDQLSPRDIQLLQSRGRALPRLVSQAGDSSVSQGPIWCGDFFQDRIGYASSVDIVVGNPPWGSTAGADTNAARWCSERQYVIPDNQIAAAFMWKAADHISSTGRVCLVLPHGILFNHGQQAVAFQKAFISRYAVERVLNLTDYQSFLFSEARHPALVLSYQSHRPEEEHTIAYWAPRTDWRTTKAEIITISEHDRTVLRLQAILRDLDDEDAPQIWKRAMWATPRDRRLLERLSESKRLREMVRQPTERVSAKPWFIAEGFQPFGENDPEHTRKQLTLPSNAFVAATSKYLQLMLLPEDCQALQSTSVSVRRRIRDTRIFRAPHVLVSKGFGRVAFADFDVSFQHALRGINGSVSDRSLLMFLAGYLRSPLAQYFLFHTSSNWGVSRHEVHVEELLRLPFPAPYELPNVARATTIVDEVARLMDVVARESRGQLIDRTPLVDATQSRINELIYEYFDVLPSERLVVEDTVRITIPSFRPGARRKLIPAIEPSTAQVRERYATRLCETLNSWGTGGESRVVSTMSESGGMGIGLVVLQLVGRDEEVVIPNDQLDIEALDHFRQAFSSSANSFELSRGLKLFEGKRLYLLKPLGQRYWSESSALNDADEIAGSILMHSSETTR